MDGAVTDWDYVRSARPRIPAGSKSERVVYRDELGRRVAIVHQFRKPNGQLGASGKPDPKMLEHEGDNYYAI